MSVEVQLLPSRNATEVNDFNPVFKPYAADPPRNLPPVIRAGVMVPPVLSFSPQQNVLAKNNTYTGADTSHTSNDVSDNGEGGIHNIALGVAIGSIVIGVVFCVSCKLLPAIRGPQRQRQGFARRQRKSLSQKLMFRERASFSHVSEDGTVRSTEKMQLEGLKSCVRS
jgi:hypothetical protein